MKAVGAKTASPTPPPNHSAAPSQAFSHYPGLPSPLKVSLVTLGEHECSYLPGRASQSRAFWAERMAPSSYHRFMDAGYRRSGKLLYQPVCRGCRACVSIRVPVATFRPTKSQRRCWRRNQDLLVGVSPAEPSDEKYDLYLRYVVGRHHRSAAEEDRESFERFLYDSPVDTLEFGYRDAAGRLLAVGLCDASPQSLSSVYFYFDPAEARRGLGTFGALYEIEAAGRLGIPHYYLGYWVDGCAAMEYKADFRPAEVLHADGLWRPIESGERVRGAAAPLT